MENGERRGRNRTRALAATSCPVERGFINTHGKIEITNKEIIVCFEKRTHNPILKEAGLEKPSAPVSWLGGRVIRLEFP